ncbi:MAG: hypothetical protein HYT65_02185 [Candidatus Yanofskybacteria bacterium]|nr:hypothetical protein [Candidatus Yanofskybacteria bacterium]
MENMEVKIEEEQRSDKHPEGSLDEFVNWRVVEKFAVTFEELGAFVDLEIPEKPSTRVREKLKAIAHFLKNNNYENTKIIAFGVAVIFGKSAMDLINIVDTLNDLGRHPETEDLKVLIQRYVETDMTKNIFMGAGSAAIQKSVETAKKTWNAKLPKIKYGLQKIIESSRETLEHGPTNA